MVLLRRKSKTNTHCARRVRQHGCRFRSAWCCPCALSAVWALLPAMGGAAGRPFRANCCTEIAALMRNLRRKRFLQTLVLRCAYETSYCFARRIINCFQNTKRHPLRIQFAQTGNLSGLWSDCRLRPLGWASLAISSEIRDENTGKHVFFRHRCGLSGSES